MRYLFIIAFFKIRKATVIDLVWSQNTVERHFSREYSLAFLSRGPSTIRRKGMMMKKAFFLVVVVLIEVFINLFASEKQCMGSNICLIQVHVGCAGRYYCTNTSQEISTSINQRLAADRRNQFGSCDIWHLAYVFVAAHTSFIIRKPPLRLRDWMKPAYRKAFLAKRKAIRVRNGPWRTLRFVWTMGSTW